MPSYDVEPPPKRLGDRVQLRYPFSKEGGQITAFAVQLEYWLDGDWQPVVRYDHNPGMSGGHDVREEGLHRDIYRGGRKVEQEVLTPPIEPNEALNIAEEDLAERPKEYIRTFERWHNVRDTTDL